MPELPEVETIRRQLQRALSGRKVEAVKCLVGRLRVPLDEKTLNGLLADKYVLAVRRRAKFLLAELAGEAKKNGKSCAGAKADSHACAIIHLGMTGSLRLCPSAENALTHDRVIFRLDGAEDLRLRDIRRFGSVEAFAGDAQSLEESYFAGFGPEPLEKNFGGDYLFEKSRKRKCPVKTFIMDQRVVVGVGNIYASESLFLAGIKPARQAGKLSRDDCAALAREIKSILHEALKWGGTTFSNYAQVDGSAGEFEQRLSVYGRAGEPCPHCGAEIMRSVLGGRSSFHCPKCQK